MTLAPRASSEHSERQGVGIYQQREDTAPAASAVSLILTQAPPLPRLPTLLSLKSLLLLPLGET